MFITNCPCWILRGSAIVEASESDVPFGVTVAEKCGTCSIRQLKWVITKLDEGHSTVRSQWCVFTPQFSGTR